MWPAILLCILSLVIAIIYLVPIPSEKKPYYRPPFEEPGLPGPKPRTGISEKPLIERPQRPQVAIIIDDMGYDPTLDRAFLNIEAPISFAFLPFAPYTRPLALKAHKLKKDVLVHLPLEPSEKDMNPGPGVILVSMDLSSMIEQLEKDIQAVPYAIGVNNHMGSLFTTDKKAMKIILAQIKRKGLFFVDSRTTKYTVAYDVARSLGVPTAQRAVFLDHDPSPKAVTKELCRLKDLAKERGSAIAIGHPHESTLKVLYNMLPSIRREVTLVPVHLLVQ